MAVTTEKLKDERISALEQFEEVAETPMLFLAVAWLVLTIVELLNDLPPFLEHLMTGIWIVFWLEFIVRLLISPAKLHFLKNNVLTLISLALPAFRIFRVVRVLRFARAARGLRLLKIFGTFNRGMRALRNSLGRKGFSYVIVLTLLVVVLGSAGIYILERDESNYFADFGTALWWTAMMITTMGSDYFPTSPEGRLLALTLAIYGFAVFGYVTATVASFFIDRDAENSESALAGQHSVDQLRDEIKELKVLVYNLSGQINSRSQDR